MTSFSVPGLDAAQRVFTTPPEWESGRAKTVTFMLTEDCQLRCRYCYFAAKNAKGRMEFDVARRTIDRLLEDPDVFDEPSVILDFIGGEPLLEIELLDRVCDYFKQRAFVLGHPWFDAYRISFATNGLLYQDPRVQRFFAKNKAHLSIGITIDGTPRKHDMQRVFPNGSGSYAAVVRSIPLWLQQFPDAATKVTVARDDLPYVRESVLHLWGLGIRHININVVFENVWQDGDDRILEEQLLLLADEIIEGRYYEGRSCSFFQRTVGSPATTERNWCGAGQMLTVDHTGNFYPCVRFTPPALQKKSAIVVGNCFEGIDHNRLRPFLALDLRSQSPPECLECQVAGGCAWCQGANYDEAESDTIYQRATYLCGMHKARVRANRYFWERLDRSLACSNTSSSS